MSIKMITEAFKLFGESKLSPAQKLVLIALADHANDEDHLCWPSLQHLQKKTGLGKNTIWQSIDALVKNGHVTRVEKGSNGPIPTATTYRINLGQSPTYLGQNKRQPRSRNGAALGQSPTSNHNNNHKGTTPGFPKGFNPEVDCRPGEDLQACKVRAWKQSNN